MVYRGRLEHSSMKSGGQVIVRAFRVDLVSEGTYFGLQHARSVIRTILRFSDCVSRSLGLVVMHGGRGAD
jgi:hypothetical protein